MRGRGRGGKVGESEVTGGESKRGIEPPVVEEVEGQRKLDTYELPSW